MNIEKMRKIDRGLGVFICWLLTLLHRLKNSFGFNKISGEPKKILFLKPAEMGTSVILCPSIEKVKELFPDSELYFVAFKENAPIFEVLKIIPEKNIFTISTDSFSHLIMDTLKSIIRIRRLKIDTVIDLEFFSRYSAIFSFLTGAERRVGFHRFNSEGLYRGEFMTHKVAYNYYMHVGVSFMSLVYALKYPAGKVTLKENLSIELLKIPKIPLTNGDKENIFKKLIRESPNINEMKKIVVISPDTGKWLPYRKWPIRYYSELSKKLLDMDDDVYVVISGTSSARKAADFLKKEINDSRIVDITGKTTLKEFIDLLNISKVIVSVDSGPAHFACLTDIGIVCIFGPDTKEIFAPLSRNAISIECDLACHPCFSVFNTRRPNCEDIGKKCLESIGVNNVLEKVKKFL